MFIIECLPITKVNKEKLSYFSAQAFAPGSIVKVPIRNQTKLALVLESKRADQHKTEIRQAGFALKKIESLWSMRFLSPEFIQACEETALYFSTTEGALLDQLLPAVILQNPKWLAIEKKNEENLATAKSQTRVEASALQTENEDRFAHYRALVREDFATKKSVFLCLPQNESIERAKIKIERGIEPYVVVLHSAMTKNEIQKNLRQALNLKHPVLVIATTPWLCLPRPDWGTIIIEEENNRGWQTLARPFFDLRFFAEKFGTKIASRVILGDSVLSIKSLWRHKEKNLSEFETVKWRLQSEAKSEIIDLTKAKPKITEDSPKTEWQALSPQLLQEVRETLYIGGNVFIFASRKGLAPIIVCRDCGHRLSCHNCDSPMVLHKAKEQNIFKCHQCGEVRDSSELCQVCQSWNLIPLGAGTDRIADELRNSLPELQKKARIFELHGDVATTNLKARGIMSDFESGRGHILVGTEMAFTYFRKKVQTTAIASIDSLFAIPDFRIRERIFRIITEARNITREKLLVQSRNKEDSVLSLALSGNLTDFYREEIEERQSLNYPPFAVFVKITLRGQRESVNREMTKLKTLLTEFEPTIFSSIHEKKGKPTAVNAVLKIREEDYPNARLSQILSTLPPHFEIKINPENLL